MESIFVYGTLKQNQPNHYHLNSTQNGFAVFKSVAKTKAKYPLVISTKYNIPFLLQNEGVGHEINGEIYDVDTDMLKFLDDFENVPAYYDRQTIEVVLPNGDVTNCWVYMIPKYPNSFLELQCFDNYDSYGEHGLRYVEKYDRDPNDESLLYNWSKLDCSK